MPTNHDETLLQRYQRETREIEARAFIHPEFGGVAKRKLDDLQAQGYTVVGYMLARAEADYTVTRGAIDIGGMVIWWNPETAAPAAQPEPVRLKTEIPPVYYIANPAAPDWYETQFHGEGQFQDRMLQRGLIHATVKDAVTHSKSMACRSPAARPEFTGVAKRKLEDLIARGYRIDGYAITKDTSRGFVTTGGMVGWWTSGEEIQRIERAAAEMAAPAAQPLLTVEMVDAAMLEMSNIHPPLKRSECERLLRAAMASRLGPPPSFRHLPADDTEGGAA